MKISLANLDKIMDKCTKKEMDLILYMGQFQDNYGVIKGIDYKDVLYNIGISKSTFYKLMYGLEEKRIIKINFFSDYGYWEVQILDNVFACVEDYKKGYIKLNYEIFHSQTFKQFTKSEKIIIFHLLKINDFRKTTIKITFRKIMEWTGKSLRSARKFVDTISRSLKIVIDNHLCIIDCLHGFDCRNNSEIDVRNRHLIDYRLKKARCRSSAKDIQDTITVLKQYKINCFDTIIQLIDKTIDNFGMLMPRFINKMAALTQ